MSEASMNCEEIRELLPAYAGGGDVSLSIRRHIARCRGCRAELETYEEITRVLADSRAHTVDPPRSLVMALKEIPQREHRLGQVRDHLARNRAAYAGGAAVALGAVGALLWKSRRQGPALA